MIKQNGWKFITVDISTEKGIRQAERLQAQGYTAAIVGIDKIQFSKKGA
jgi:hypothetical protein